MVHHFLQVHQMDRVKVAAAICRSFDKTIIFCRTKRGADRLVEQLQKEGVIAAAIHGDLARVSAKRRWPTFRPRNCRCWWRRTSRPAGCTSTVDCVMHFDPPEDQKAYLHRSGRTARAGSTGVVVSLLLWNQAIDAEVIMRRLNLKRPIIEVFSNDPRLADLANWTRRCKTLCREYKAPARL